MPYIVMLGKMIAFSCLVIIGITEHRYKKVIAGKDAYRELEANLAKLLNGLLEKWINRIFQACYRRSCHWFLKCNGKDISRYEAPTLLGTKKVNMFA
ncbi:MAG: hypothetical protein ACTS73_01065 [Arsenophonus sp. NEOnobi-MAG3]